MEPRGLLSLLQSRRGSSHLGCDGGFGIICPAAESFRSVFAGVLCNVFHDVTNYMFPFSLHANWVRGACMGLRLDFISPIRPLASLLFCRGCFSRAAVVVIASVAADLRRLRRPLPCRYK
jgi:hypothetical protein